VFNVSLELPGSILAFGKLLHRESRDMSESQEVDGVNGTGGRGDEGKLEVHLRVVAKAREMQLHFTQSGLQRMIQAAGM